MRARYPDSESFVGPGIGAGRCLDYDQTGPEALAEAIAAEIGCPVSYRPVETDGAARAAALLAELI